MAVRRWHRLLVAGSAILIAGAGASEAQQQRETEGELVQPEVQEVAPADDTESSSPALTSPCLPSRTRSSF